MVTIVVKKSKLLQELKLTQNELENVLFNLKSEVEPIDEDNISIEINADRLDMLSVGGISRAIKGILGKELGESKYAAVDTDYKLVVSNVETRPYALGAVIYNIKLDDEEIKELIQFQEKLHDTIGRKRKKVAIGIHDLDKIDSKVIKYEYIPLDYKFVPLNSNVEMSVSEIIKNTEQGKEYGNISINNKLTPAILQDNGEVLSIPPIINSNKTRLDSETKNLFIDVTGTSFDAVYQTLDILSSNLAEEGAKIGFVKIEAPYSSTIPNAKSPIMKHKTISVNPTYINNRIGVSLDKDTIVKSILKMRMNATLDDNINVIVPPYRVDIMRDVDIAEDVAMAIGYENLGVEKFQSSEIGKYLKISMVSRAFRDLSIGAGFQEIYSLVLTKSTNLMDNYVKILNPISIEYDAVRNSLIWTTLDFLSKNQHARFPIKIFEVGDVVTMSESDTGYSNETRGCFAIMDSKVSYENLQSLVHQIITNIVGTEPSYLKNDNLIFIRGRGASISIKGNIVGIIGEVNPEILSKFELSFPVVLSEIYLSKLNNLI